VNSSTEIYIELFKRKQFDKIPVHFDETGFYYLSPKQIDALNLMFDEKTFFIGYGGSARSGKSQLMCFALTFLSLCFDDTRWLLGRRELKNLKATTVQTLLKTFAFYGIDRDADYVYNDQQGFYEFQNKSRIILRDTKYEPRDPEMSELGGLELTGAFIDESAENVIKPITTIASRVNVWNNEKLGIKGFVFESFNPVKNHVNERYWLPYKKGEETEHKKFVRALSSDNPHPDVRKWEENILKTGDQRIIERLLYGNFDYDDDENVLIQYDKIMDMFTNSFVEDTGETFISSDVAVSNDLFVLWVWKGFRVKEISAIKNVSKPQSTLTESGEWINKVDFTPLINEYERLSKKWNVPRSNICYDADGIGHKLRTFLSGAIGLNNNARPLDPAYDNLKTQMACLFAEKANTDQVFFDCVLQSDIKERLIKEIGAFRIISDVGQKIKINPKAEVKTIIGHSPDIFEAGFYRMLFWITRKK
jgi:phage terminase large subunit